MTALAEALLEAHVRHDLERLTGTRLDAGIRDGVAAFFASLEEVAMSDVLARAQIHEVIDRYVIELKVSGGITELAGEMSRVVFSSASAKETRVDDVLTPGAYEEFAEKLAELEGGLRRIVGYLVQSAAFRTLAARFMVYDAAALFVRASPPGEPTWKRRLREAMQSRFPELQREAHTLVSHFGDVLAQKMVASTERRVVDVVDVEWLRLLADELWNEISARPISDAGKFVSAEDLEDFVVLGYEVWSKFRKTAYFRSVAGEVVDRLFDKYGEESLRSVIRDMGVTEDMVIHELLSFLRPFFAEAQRSGFLEARIRARLETFYRSSVAREILGADVPVAPGTPLAE